MTAKKQRIQDVIEVINTTSIEPETEVIEQLVKKTPKVGKNKLWLLITHKKIRQHFDNCRDEHHSKRKN
ncbi:hypothetical protein AGMMS50262_20710 [Bacteroidia bacterium]|nr:hypothetical protein AGMMS50262_20710 [Bacteroidia bacterium]